MSTSPIIALTGGPGGGKTTLINELLHNPSWQGKIAALPEAISLMGGIRISPREQLFQRVMVHMQMSLEDGLVNALKPDNARLILCHRGSLDPLAYWLDRGWPGQEFFEYTETTCEEHYRRYSAVIHLVTAADSAPSAYTFWPDAHRQEDAQHAIRLDRLLREVWQKHPHYYCLANDKITWEEKSRRAKDIIQQFL